MSDDGPGRHQPYPVYKDSGIEWLGEVPAHWGMTFIDKVIDSSRRITYGIVQPGTPDPEGIFMVRGQNYSNGWSNPVDFFRVSPEIEAPYKRSRLKSGDVVMTIVGAGTGNVAIIPDWLDGANLTQTTARIAVDSAKGINRYIAFLLQSSVGMVNVELTVKGAAQPGLNLGHVAKYRIVLPPLLEQQSIADFLDQKMAEIDALLAQKKRLIELLQEKRAALITQAVTKGLDFKTPMKDSGVEWLGQIPAHWKTMRLSYAAGVSNGTTPAKHRLDYWNDGTIPWILSGKVNDYSVEVPSEYITQKALEENSLSLIPKGSLVMGMIGQGKTRGMVAYLNIDTCINQNLAAIVPNQYTNGRYLHHLLEHGYKPIREIGRGGNQEALNTQIISNLRVVIPPLYEQELIASTLDYQIERIKRLIGCVESEMAHLKEFRTALISAAVTGKIDVREEAT